MVDEMKKLVILGEGGFAKEVAWLAKDCGFEVVAYLDEHEEKNAHKYEDCYFIIAINNPVIRRKVVSNMLTIAPAARYATLIHPNFVSSNSVNIQEGCIITSSCAATVDIRIGKHCILNIGTTVGHDTTTGDFCTLAPKSNICGDIAIGNGVEIGAGAVIRQGLKIGDDSMICMGSVVVKEVKAGTTVMGNPARLIKN
jgi:sugar O-acyltransferase (sialic acid O-acetyltransferase NeuD family)